MKEKGIDSWNVILIITALILLFWALLKSLKIINSPIWLEMIPYFSIGVGLIGGVYKLGKIKQGIDYTASKVNKLLAIEERFTRLESEHNLAMQGKIKFKY